MKHNQIGWIRLYGRVYHTQGKDVVAMATMTEPIEDDYQAASAEAERVPDTGTVPVFLSAIKSSFICVGVR